MYTQAIENDNESLFVSIHLSGKGLSFHGFVKKSERKILQNHS